MYKLRWYELAAIAIVSALISTAITLTLYFGIPRVVDYLYLSH
jgi:hypothetical protein